MINIPHKKESTAGHGSVLFSPSKVNHCKMRDRGLFIQNLLGERFLKLKPTVIWELSGMRIDVNFADGRSGKIPATVHDTRGQ